MVCQFSLKKLSTIKPELLPPEKRFAKQLHEFVLELVEWPSSPKIYLLAPPFATPSNGEIEVVAGINNGIIKTEIHVAMANCSAEYGTGFVDLYALTEGHPEYFADGVHPNALGNAVIAQCIFEVLQPADLHTNKKVALEDNKTN